jgi:hypothetical protein
MRDPSSMNARRAVAIGRSFLCALCIACSFGSTASGTVTNHIERPAFERAWVAAATGALAVGNLVFILRQRTVPPLALLGIGSGLVLAASDEGKRSDLLAGAGIVLGVSQLFRVKSDRAEPDSEPTRARLQLGITADLQRVLLQYRF